MTHSLHFTCFPFSI